MILLQITIFSLLVLLCILSFLVFNVQNKKQQKIHLQRVGVHKNAIAKNKEQIRKRHVYFSRYDFIEQNIEDVLTIQQDIELCC